MFCFADGYISYLWTLCPKMFTIILQNSISTNKIVILLWVSLIEDGFSICLYSKPLRQDSKRFILCCLFEIFNNNSFEQLCFNIRLCQSNNQWRGSFQKIQISLLPSLSTFQFTYSYISRPRDVSTSMLKVCWGAKGAKLNDLFLLALKVLLVDLWLMITIHLIHATLTHIRGHPGNSRESQLDFFLLDHEKWFSKVWISSRNMRITICNFVLV